MYLTREQEKIISGEYGWAAAKALELIVRVGEALGAEELIPIVHAHVSGISYSNIRDYGLEFILDFYRRGGKARVFTTINPGCVDYSGLSQIIDNKFMEKQKLIDEALVQMGFKPVFTCIPYYYRAPLPGEHLAWGESSAVIFANSVYGAYSNKEGGPIALAASITGYTYKAGLHLPENRVGEVLVQIEPGVPDAYIGALGLWIGDNIRERVVLWGFEKLDMGSLKNLLASMAASGNHAFAVINGVTPRNTYILELKDKVTIETRDLEDYIGEDISRSQRILGYIGCPHLHPFELVEIYRLVEKYGRVKRGDLLVTIPLEYIEKFKHVIYALKARGVDIAAGTCPVVSLLKRRYDIVLTNSGKAAFYLRRIHGLKVKITSLKEVVRSVCE